MGRAGFCLPVLFLRVPREMRAGSTVSFPSSVLIDFLKWTLFPQLYDDTKQHSEADHAELTHCIMLQGKERSFGNAWRCPGQKLSHKPQEWA